MRPLLAGLILLWLLLPSLALAQVDGVVESIGFNNYYRPGSWTPIVVKLIPETTETRNYQIQIVQHDQDRDRPHYVWTVTVTGAPEDGVRREQKFWAYFLPEPIKGGLPETNTSGRQAELEARLEVYLCNENGKQIKKLNIGSMPINVEPPGSMHEPRRGSKLILAVHDGRGLPDFRDYKIAGFDRVLGVMEDVELVPVRPDQLPPNILGYDAVDAIVWCDPTVEAQVGSSERIGAVREYVRNGGKLLILQPGERDRTLMLGDLMPVNLIDIADVPSLNMLAIMGNPADGDRPAPGGNFKLARALPKSGAYVDFWELTPDGQKVPYVVRATYGLGSVIWVAQNLADPTVVRAMRYRWPFIWDAIFGWKNTTVVIGDPNSDQAKSARDVLGVADPVDLGYQFTQGIDPAGKGAAMVAIVIVFFVAYWIVAGPGLFVALAAKGKTQLSWFLFAGAAVAATLLTLLVVELVVRGPPVLQHLSFVQGTPELAGIVRSRMGLYIPRDGGQEIELQNVSPDGVSYVAGFRSHPQHPQSDSPYEPLTPYAVDVQGQMGNDSYQIEIPYRSTLKRLEARWAGQLEGGVLGQLKGVARHDGHLAGQVSNGTGRELKNVYFIFRHREGAIDEDLVWYLPLWPVGASLELGQAFRMTSQSDVYEIGNGQGRYGLPGQNKKLQGSLTTSWLRYWYSRLSGVDPLWTESGLVQRAFPMLSIYDRLKPPANTKDSGRRFELLRRGARHLDLSHIVAAGDLLVLAETGGPLPFPMEVEGDPLGGTGTTYYQFVVLVDRSEQQEAEDPVTQPSTQPAGLLSEE